MAEGWARHWLEEQRKNVASLSEPEKEFLDSLVIASVALDSSSVFVPVETADIGDSSNRQKQRKPVKGKAVQAMAALGVDISKCTPKTLDELLGQLVTMSSSSSSSSFTCENCESESEKTLMTSNKNIIATPDSNDSDNVSDNNKPVDKLIVMYSCADSVKHHVANRSRGVIQWNIEAPTAAAKGGEGDQAYRRISLEIRHQVEELMDGLLQGAAAASDANAATASDDCSSTVVEERIQQCSLSVRT